MGMIRVEWMTLETILATVEWMTLETILATVEWITLETIMMVCIIHSGHKGTKRFH